VVGVWKCMQERSTTKEENERNAVERVERREKKGQREVGVQDVRCKKCSTKSGTSEVKWRERDGAKRNEASGMNERGTRRET
jgi:hypothetical protein